MSQHPSYPPEPPRVNPARNLALGPALAAGAAVFLAFVAYGRLAPTTYRATAQIVLQPVAGKSLALPSDPPASQRLRDVAVDEETLDQTATLLALGSGTPGQTAAKQRVEKKLEIVAHGADAFDLSFLDATADGAQRVTNLLARHAAARAVRALGHVAPDESALREAARTKSAADLAAFMAAHPELTPPTVAPVAPKDTPDTDSAALRAERDQIQAKLARMPEASGDSDNPFGGDQTSASAEAARLRRRVAEIDQTLKTRQRTDKAKPSLLPKVDPAVETEWKRLMQAVANPVVEVQAPAQDFTVMLRDAALPTAPIDPDRHRLGFLGALAALLTMLIVVIAHAVFRRAGQQTAPATWRQTGSEPPPRPPSDPPYAGTDAQRGSEPPRFGSEPPRPGSDLPRAGSEPPRLGSDAPFARTEHSEPPRPASEPPQPIVPLGITQVLAADFRPSSSNPPPPEARNPLIGAPAGVPIDTSISATPPAGTAPVNAGASPAQRAPSPIPPVPAPVVSSSPPPPAMPGPAAAAPPSPPPPPPSPVPPRPTPGYEELRRAPVGAALKGTLVGMAIDPRGLEKTAFAPGGPALGTPPVGTPFDPGPARDADAPRSTLRPPPLEGSATATPPAGTAPSGSGRPRAASHPVIETTGVDVDSQTPPQPGSPVEKRRGPPGTPESEEAWTGPSRAHRRSMPAARRTTQMLGSPIPPVVRGSTMPPGERSTPVPGSSTGTGYSYVSTRPSAEVQRPPQDTPPYYQTPTGAPRQGTAPPPHASQSQVPGKRTRVTVHPARQGWSADPSLDFRARRALADQLLPLAVEKCFVLGITAVRESRAEKSRVAAELALALAESNHPRVLLLEGDFQWPSVHQTMRVDMPLAAGFSQQLRGRSPTKADAWTVIECSPCLHVLAEGIMRSPGHILSVQFEESVRSLRTYYDLIVLDGPDASAEGECRALANVVDGFVLIAPPTGSRQIPRAVELFPDKAFSLVLGV